MFKQFIIFFCFLCFTTSSYAQKIKKSDSLNVKEVIDTLLIDRDMNNWSVRVFANYKGQKFNLKNGDDKLSFVPNNKMGVGVGLGTSKLIVDLAVNLKGHEENPTERFDMQGSLIIGTNHLVNLLVQRYKGFNVKNNFGAPEIFREDLLSVSVGLNYLYTLEDISFSSSVLKAGLAKKNRKHFVSGGFGGFLLYDNFTADNSVIPYDPNFNEDAYLDEYKGIGIGVSCGVLSMFVLPANFFATINIIPGIGVMYKKGVSETGEYNVSNPLLYKFDYDVAIGYNFKRIYVTFSYGSGMYTTNLDYGLNYFFSNTKAKLAVGYKIQVNKKLKTPF